MFVDQRAPAVDSAPTGTITIGCSLTTITARETEQLLLSWGNFSFSHDFATSPVYVCVCVCVCVCVLQFHLFPYFKAPHNSTQALLMPTQNPNRVALSNARAPRFISLLVAVALLRVFLIVNVGKTRNHRAPGSHPPHGKIR